MCSCDYDPPFFYVRREVRARKAHRCCECGGLISPGDTYERVNAMWGHGHPPESIATCPRCVALVDHASKHFEYFCRLHYNLLDGVRDDLAGWGGPDGTGVFFRTLRLLHAIERGRAPAKRDAMEAGR